jgi:hypothetical protein
MRNEVERIEIDGEIDSDHQPVVIPDEKQDRREKS